MKILAYSSALTFGGHEVMSLKGLHSLLEHGHQVVLLYPRQNEKMRQMCAPLSAEFGDRFLTVQTTAHSRRLQIFFTWFDWRVLASLYSAFKKISPELVLSLQGDIEQGSEAIVAAALARIRSLSYIPMILKGRQRGIRFASLRDFLSGPVYSLCDRMIVISSAFEANARNSGARDAIVVYNCIDTEFFDAPSKRDLIRKRLGFRDDEIVAGFVGRISYYQKGVDRLLEILESNAQFFSRNRMLIVGSGPDDGKLSDDLKSRGLEQFVVRVSWTDERFAYFDCMDLFLCTSRFEGIPLTVLEASARNVPVMSMPLPTLTDHLPLRYQPEVFDAEHWGAQIKSFSRPHDPAAGAARRVVGQIACPATFAVAFEKAVATATPASGSITVRNRRA